MKTLFFLFLLNIGLVKATDPKGISAIDSLRKGCYAKDSKGNYYLRIVRSFFHKGQDLNNAVTSRDIDTVERLERKSIVQASDGKPAMHVAIILNDATDITKFKIGDVSGTIDANAHTVALEVPNGTDLTALQPEVLLSQGAQVSPRSGVATDFTNPVNYTVTAEDGTEQVWAVTVTEAA